MFNLLPGSGLGFTGSKEIAFGLGAVTVTEVPVIPPGGGGGGGGGGFTDYPFVSVYDNAYSKRNDDNEVVEILSILFQVIL